MSNDLTRHDDLAERPSPARMFDYYLGGHHNFAIDREAAETIRMVYHDLFLAARTSRAFLRRVVTFLSQQGIDQFLDLGAGIPTVGNTHEIAHTFNPAARVLYVDNDPIAVSHGQAILHGETTMMIQADLCQIERLLHDAALRQHLDFTRPIGVLLVAVLHYMPDDTTAQRIVQTLREAIPAGSFIVITHGTIQNAPPEVIAQIEQTYARSTNPVRLRSYGAIHQLFAGLDLVAPGLVYAPLWRPEESDDLLLDDPARSLNLAGVGVVGATHPAANG